VFQSLSPPQLTSTGNQIHKLTTRLPEVDELGLLHETDGQIGYVPIKYATHFKLRYKIKIGMEGIDCQFLRVTAVA
jgi:hypothetical protein